MKKRFEMIAKRFLSILTCLVIISIFFALYGLFQISILDKGYASYFGYALFEVESGSMSPTINVKDMVIVRETDKIKKDDIITYELEGNFITHRVVEVKEKKVVAKGDYNNYEDKTIPRDCIIGKVVLRIPKFGVWKEIVLSPIVLVAIFFTMLLFGLGFSYEDKKLAAKKRVGYTFKDEIFEEDDNKPFNKIKKKIKKLTGKFSKVEGPASEAENSVEEDKTIEEITDNKEPEEENSVKEEKTIEEITDDKEPEEAIAAVASSDEEKMSITCKCKWIDDNNRDGKRPDSITVKLLCNGEVVATKEVKNDELEFAFENLDKHENNKYTVDSNMVPGYKKEISEFEIINTHAPKKMNITGEITWIDEDNKNNTRPSSVTIKLINNSTVVSSKTITKDNKWKYTFIDLYKYENGKEIKYEIDEEEIKGYNKSVSGYNITNTHSSSNK